jgi:ubiquinone/menaquinone biosynthesis C-methylase UbiE
MIEIQYPPILEKISHNVKVIWFGTAVTGIKDAWTELAARIIHVHKPVDVEQMLDMKGFEDVKEDF